jgi:hypothetical protein
LLAGSDGTGEVGLWERGSSGLDDPVYDDGGAWGKETSSLMGSCLAFEMPKVEGWGLGGFMLSFPFQTARFWKRFT